MTHTIDLDVLNSHQELLITARLLATDLFQAFGIPEVPQITKEGALRMRYFVDRRQQFLTDWATQHGVGVTNATLT
jgi:hypothetical protein